MAVAKSQVEELFLVVAQHVPRSSIWPLLRDLARTEAYRRNRSFRDTVDRLTAYERHEFASREGGPNG